MNKTYKDDRISTSIRMRQKIPKMYNTFNSVRFFGWPIKGTKTESAQGTRCRPSYQMRGLCDAGRNKSEHRGMQVKK